MKKFLTLTLFAFLFVISAGFSTPDTLLTTKQDDLLHSIFYKENRITTTDYKVAEDSNGDPITLRNIFEFAELDLNLFTDNTSGVSLSVSNNILTATITGTALATDIRYDYTFNISNKYYILAQTLTEDSVTVKHFLYANSTAGSIYQEIITPEPNFWNQFSIYSVPSTDDNLIRIRAEYNSAEDALNNLIKIRNPYIVDVTSLNFANEPTKTQLDEWYTIYSEIEENGTYYYYTFDGSMLSILWVSMLFGSLYIHVRRAEREDMARVLTESAIFFILGIVLLRVIQLLIS